MRNLFVIISLFICDIIVAQKVPPLEYPKLHAADSSVCSTQTKVCQDQEIFVHASDRRCGCVAPTNYQSDYCDFVTQCLEHAPWTRLFHKGSLIGCGCFATIAE